MLGFLAKIFGSKSERDIKALQPFIPQINEEYAKLASISNDELRQKTIDFKATIASALAEIDTTIADLKAKATEPELSLAEKTSLYDQVDSLGKDRKCSFRESIATDFTCGFRCS